jgi:hypothetical protein
MPRAARYSDRVARRFAIAFVACGLLGVLDTAHYAYYLYDSGQAIDLVHAGSRELPTWLVWALAVPVVGWAGERFRLEWPPHVGVVLAHLAGAATAVLIFALLPAISEHALGYASPARSWFDDFRQNLAYQAPKGVITYGATLGLGYVAAHAQRSRQLLELRSELSKAQLTALRMQLNPHFFFNALHTIGALVRDGSSTSAVEMIEKLGDVLRRVLRADGDIEAPLRDEIDLLRAYLEIEQARFGERLRVAWQVDPQSESVPVPPLILQPLVENALRHGLSKRARPGSLTISSQIREGRLELVVADDGVGLSDPVPRSGVGLANVRARLVQMYGDAAQLSLSPSDAGGVRARIVLPVRA